MRHDSVEWHDAKPWLETHEPLLTPALLSATPSLRVNCPAEVYTVTLATA